MSSTSVLSPRRQDARGQTTIETALVFSSLLFLVFAIMNMSILLHTKLIASYANFMAARSFQVLGDQTAREIFVEATDLQGETTQEFLAETKDSKHIAFIRAAEDIFTCALPWMTVPEDDRLGGTAPKDPNKITPDERCQAGRRKYEKLNIGDMSFAAWDPENAKAAAFAGGSGLEKLEPQGFSEPGRGKMQYGVLKLPYRTPIIFNLGGLFGDGFHSNAVFVPVVLNPGLDVKLQEASGDAEGEFKNSNFKKK